jgi:REP element-mobilizing transposase RayT
VAVSHQRRPRLEGVVHVTQKLRRGLPSMRTRRAFGAVREAIAAGNQRPGFRVVAFSVLSNHLHLVVEGGSTLAVSRGMQGLAIRIAKALNRAWKRSGGVFLERFHARVARGMKRVRRVLLYVLQNARKHGLPLPAGVPDPCSSGPWFPWREHPPPPPEPAPVVAIHDQWLASVVMSWGLSLHEVPASGEPGAHP